MNTWQNPEAFWLLALLPLLFLRHWQSLRGGCTLQHPAVFSMKSRAAGWLHLPFLLKAAALVLLVAALARPQKALSGQDVSTEGVDIMLALDTSGSMEAQDFTPRNRLEVAKNVMEDFIRGRNSDRIGLVVFAARAVTRCPLTVDYDVLTQLVESTRTGMLPDGTAIGNALAAAVNRLRASPANSRIVVLVTDGVNNTGEIDPYTAAELAQTAGIKVYTVGVGREGTAPVPVMDQRTGQRIMMPMEVKIDEELLKAMAARTGGRYFRALDPAALREIFRQIDRLEKSEVKIRRWSEYDELFSPWLKYGLLLLLIWLLAAETIFRRLP